jgi:hypothetical protein
MQERYNFDDFKLYDNTNKRTGKGELYLFYNNFVQFFIIDNLEKGGIGR